MPAFFAPLLQRATRRMMRREDGSATALSLFLMVACLALAAFAIDLQRVETLDIQLQNVADTAAHAALIARLATLPATLTKEELLAFLDGKYTGTYESFCHRLRRHKLMTYDPFLGEFGAWVNHCVPEREQS